MSPRFFFLTVLLVAAIFQTLALTREDSPSAGKAPDREDEVVFFPPAERETTQMEQVRLCNGAISYDGSTFVALSADMNLLYVANLEDGACTSVLRSRHRLMAPAVSDSGRYVAFALRDEEKNKCALLLADVVLRQVIGRIGLNENALVEDLDFSDNEKWLSAYVVGAGAKGCQALVLSTYGLATRDVRFDVDGRLQDLTWRRGRLTGLFYTPGGRCFVGEIRPNTRPDNFRIPPDLQALNETLADSAARFTCDKSSAISWDRSCKRLLLGNMQVFEPNGGGFQKRHYMYSVRRDSLRHRNGEAGQFAWTDGRHIRAVVKEQGMFRRHTIALREFSSL